MEVLTVHTLIDHMIVLKSYFSFLQESRVLRTVPLLAACLPPDKCKILVGRRFSEDR